VSPFRFFHSSRILRRIAPQSTTELSDSEGAISSDLSGLDLVHRIKDRYNALVGIV
jgi:hypothetical protein